MWSITSNAALLRKAASQPRIGGTTMRCADDDTGRNSVSPWMMPMTMAWRIRSIGRTVSPGRGRRPGLWSGWRGSADEQRRHHQRDRGQQLDEHVEGRARGVLERVTHGVTDDRRG